MARIRTVKPELWQDEEVGQLTRDARLLFIGLITQADDEGRLVGASRLLWSQVYPWDDYNPDALAEWLDELEAAGIIQRYEAHGRPYLILPGWKRHQKISHPTRSKLPKPSRNGRKHRASSGSSPEGSRSPPEALRKAPEDSGGSPKASSLIGSDRIGGEGKTPLTPLAGGNR